MRTNLDANCVEFEKNYDKCKKCKESYHLINSNTQCKLDVTGVDGCLIHESKELCKKCDSKNYLTAD